MVRTESGAPAAEVLREIRALLYDEAIYFRVIQMGAVLVIATVADKADRTPVLTLSVTSRAPP